MIAMNPTFNWARFGGEALQDLGYGLGNAPTVGNAFGVATRYGAQQQPGRDQMATLEEQRKRDALEKNQTSEWIKANFPQFSNLPPEQGWQAAMGDLAAKRNAGSNLPASAQEYQFAVKNGFTGTFPEWMQTGRNGAGGPQLGMTQQWAIDPKTNQWVLGQMSTSGDFVQTDMGGLQPVGPYDLNASKAAGTNFGKQTGDAQFDLPSAKLTVDQTIDALNEIRANPDGMAENFGNILGLPTQMIPARPGTKMADFRNSVSRGANLAFMQAREMLRGGGQITDFESKKAESAITDMQIAMESGSQAMFEKALNDFEQAVKDGYAKLQSQASVMPGYGQGAPASTPAGPDYKSKYGLE